MDTNLQIFTNEEFGYVRTIEEMRSNDYMGFVYVLEWDNVVKIGCTKYPYKRLLTLQRQAEQYGNVKLGSFALSKEHTNYAKNEKKLHNRFRDYRRGNTELFNISLQQAITEFSSCLELLDESEIIERRERVTMEFFQHLLLGDIQMDNMQIHTDKELGNNDTHIHSFKDTTLTESTNLLHEVTSLVREMDKVMRDQNSCPSDIAKEFKNVCEQFGIKLSDNFVKKPVIS